MESSDFGLNLRFRNQHRNILYCIYLLYVLNSAAARNEIYHFLSQFSQIVNKNLVKVILMIEG